MQHVQSIAPLSSQAFWPAADWTRAFCCTASAYEDRKGLQKMIWSVINLSLVCIQLFSSEGKAEEYLSVSSMVVSWTHILSDKEGYNSLCVYFGNSHHYSLGWQLITERVKGDFAWSEQPSSRSYPDWKASRWKLHVHLYQQISDKAFQKIKKSEKKGGNDRRGKGVALHWQVKFTNKLKVRTASTISSSNILRIQRNNKSEEDIYYCKGCCITSLVSSGRTVKWK